MYKNASKANRANKERVNLRKLEGRVKQLEDSLKAQLKVNIHQTKQINLQQIQIELLDEMLRAQRLQRQTTLKRRNVFASIKELLAKGAA